MDTESFLQRLGGQFAKRDQMVHAEELSQRLAAFADVDLEPRLRAALAAQGIDRLYTHQAEAVGHVRDGRHVVVVTSTASGKTLCYHIPILEALLADPMATALAIYPTKALAQDQFRGLSRLADAIDGLTLLAGPYDGDTPPQQRRKLRSAASVILTNPDMLHQGILPQHARWNRFFQHLRYVVIDEVHAYRGVFGSHLANVMRRLHRICRHFGSQPSSSAPRPPSPTPRSTPSRSRAGPWSS